MTQPFLGVAVLFFLIGAAGCVGEPRHAMTPPAGAGGARQTGGAGGIAGAAGSGGGSGNQAGRDGGSAGGAGGTASGAGGNSAAGGAGGARTDAPVLPPDSAPDGGPGPTEVIHGQPAANVRIVKVELNQAVAVPIGPDAAGGALSLPMRKTKVIANRTTLVRAHYELGAGWVPRNIQAVLSLTSSAGATVAMPTTKMLAASSNGATLDGTFNWKLTAAQTLPGLSAHIELYETRGAPANGALLDQRRFPKEGAADLGIQGGTMELHVVLVPLNVGGTVLTVTPADLQLWNDYLHGVYPIQKAVLTVHPTVDATWSMFTNGQEDDVFDMCAKLKATEKAAPHVYYVMLIPGSKSSVGWDGSSKIASASPNAGSDRCSMVISTRSNSLTSKALTFGHELGHAHGLRHAPCGGAGGPDSTYPYPRALIGVQGYNVIKNVLYDPAKITDFMSYCEPAWISDHFYNKLETRVRIQSGWSMPQSDGVVAFNDEQRSVRALFREADGKAHDLAWGIILGGIDGLSGLDDEATPSSAGSVRIVDGARAGQTLPFQLQALEATHGLSEFRFELPTDNDATAFD
ncbi:MAG TPA: hypothetical protein VGF45_12865, partial [Polyangia bacterium]